MKALIVAVGAIVLWTLSSDAHAAESAWPPSQCMNGWVDRMTGMCPYQKHLVAGSVRGVAMCDRYGCHLCSRRDDGVWDCHR